MIDPMKKYAKNCVLFLLSALMILSLACCGKAEKEEIGTENTPEKILPDLVAGPVSPIRTGTERQGIFSLDNGFECTETGVYFMCWTPTGRWRL